MNSEAYLRGAEAHPISRRAMDHQNATSVSVGAAKGHRCLLGASPVLRGEFIVMSRMSRSDRQIVCRIGMVVTPGPTSYSRIVWCKINLIAESLIRLGAPRPIRFVDSMRIR